VLMDSNMYSYHKETNLNVMAYSASAGGYFAKKANGELTDSLNAKYDNNTNKLIYNDLLLLSKESGISINQLNLLYIVFQPFTSIALAAFSNIEQLKDSVGILTGDYDANRIQRFNALKKFVL